MVNIFVEKERSMWVTPIQNEWMIPNRSNEFQTAIVWFVSKIIYKENFFNDISSDVMEATPIMNSSENHVSTDDIFFFKQRTIMMGRIRFGIQI